jgi:hypothetical protein
MYLHYIYWFVTRLILVGSFGEENRLTVYMYSTSIERGISVH